MFNVKDRKANSMYFSEQIPKEGKLKTGGYLHLNHSTGVIISEQTLVCLSKYINYILDQILRHGI